MFTFTSYVLRNYYQATGWNEDNLYSNLTRSSTAILDFTVPRGLNFSISKSPNALFSTTYSMNALPLLNGSIGYIFTSCNLDILRSGNVRFKDMVDRFKVYDQPRIPDQKEEIWLAGRRVDIKDYLLYGRMYIPSGRLDALYAIRLSPTIQAVVAAISDPRPNNLASNARSRSNHAGHGLNNLMLSLQQDTGRWCSEYTWSADDGMFGFRVLRNFGKLRADSEELMDERPTWRVNGRKRVDEEEAMEGGLKGRLSAGAEIYFSAIEKSAGVSTGIRFTTLPDATSQSATIGQHSLRSSQPPSTITAIFNPMMGHISTAYAARVLRDLSVCSRFDFNIYSYESEWTMGAEWWVRRSLEGDTIQRFVDLSSEQGQVDVTLANQNIKDNSVQGVVKGRISTNTDISLMWEGRLRNLFVSLGVVSDLAGGSKPIRAIGLELSYLSSE